MLIKKCKIGCARIFEILTVAFGESTMSRTQVQMWYKRFKEAREDVNYDAGPGRLSNFGIDENIETVKKMCLEFRELLLERLLMMLAYRSAHAKQLLLMF